MRALIEHVRSFRTSGTVMPSSVFLVDRLVRGIDFAHATTIVELGAGDGCVTRQILRRMRPDARLLSFEINPVFVEQGNRIGDPRLTMVPVSATALPEVLREEGIDEVDAVVSSLPLSIMDDDVVDRILDASHDSLAPSGRFVQYQYSLSQRHRFSDRYDDVSVGFTLFNVPPAFVYDCSARRVGAKPPARSGPGVWAFYAGVLAALGMIGRALQELTG